MTPVPRGGVQSPFGRERGPHASAREGVHSPAVSESPPGPWSSQQLVASGLCPELTRDHLFQAGARQWAPLG